MKYPLPLALLALLAFAVSAPAQNSRITNDQSNPVPANAAAARAAVVIPADGADLPNAATRGIYVGGAGNVKVDLVTGGTGITFTAVPVGTVLAVQAKRVYATGTTATLMVALY